MKVKIENPDGSGYSVQGMTRAEAMRVAIGYSRRIDGAFIVYIERSNVHQSLVDIFGLDHWQRIGHAENGKWTPHLHAHL